jgi:hypothetical protein
MLSVYFSSKTSLIVSIDGKTRVYNVFLIYVPSLGKCTLNNTLTAGKIKYSNVKLDRKA